MISSGRLKSADEVVASRLRRIIKALLNDDLQEIWTGLVLQIINLTVDAWDETAENFAIIVAFLALPQDV